MTAGRLPIAGHRASLIIALFFAAVSLGLFSSLMLWVLLLMLCAVMVRISLYIGKYRHAPKSLTVNLLAVLCAITLAWFTPQLGLLLAMVNLLVMACALKLMLLTRRRDFLHLFGCGLFLIGCGYIFNQSVFSAAFHLLLLLVCLVALSAVYAPGQALPRQIRSLTVVSVQAIPIALLLFLIIPQLPPLWKMPTGSSTTSGLTEKVTPGDIAKLTLSTDLVFNATFTGAVPDKNERYWRAITLEHFDGKSWQVSELRKQTRKQYQSSGAEFSPEVVGAAYHYQVIAEPTGETWLYAIDVALANNFSSRDYIWQSADYQLIASQPLRSKWAYDVSSYPATPLNQSLLSVDRRINLQLPQSGNPRTAQWVKQLRQTFSDDSRFINAIMAHFAQPVFRYTLTPTPMPLNPVDAFLFDHQAGFCSHYASAMAYALRLAGIPARMVTGYQGGETLAANVLSVHQYDAHAWVEAMLGEQGWVRFDPTSVVAPARLQFGLQEAIEESGELLDNNPFSGLRQLPVLANLRHLFANMDYLWSRWVLGFNANMQQNLLTLILGKITPLRLTVLFLAIMAVIAGLLALYFLPKWRRNPPPEHFAIYHKGVTLVARFSGIPRMHLAPRQYMEKVRPCLPLPAAMQFSSLTQKFEIIEYHPATGDRVSKEMIRMKVTLRLLKKSLQQNKR
ncbi:DUF3488 domain-containing transglutaminase family protein [Alteromonas pelagimontana]|uniref:DUF3488 domain-containing transglutaminase family protein n=1 Tax=Alteromonas pelagimontana TaxID=1858656 RepID=A0A6M4M915_9ALTE|nr:DUF3488 and transglutaminase-like domain-containing protein [Alteromonas pelagimontana]QJR79681.1 DUF3488 domain-containing transglutaminase family protein [Alteromonas pelagimontana]